MTFFAFDYNNWPVVILTIQGKPTNEKDMKLFLEAWTGVYTYSMQANTRYKLMFDVRKSTVHPMKDFNHLRVLGEWLVKIKSLTETWMERTAIIVSDPVMRFIIASVFQIYKAVRPFKVFDEKMLHDAKEWLFQEDDGDLKSFTNEYGNMSQEEFEAKIRSQYRDDSSS